MIDKICNPYRYHSIFLTSNQWDEFRSQYIGKIDHDADFDDFSLAIVTTDVLCLQAGQNSNPCFLSPEGSVYLSSLAYERMVSEGTLNDFANLISECLECIRRKEIAVTADECERILNELVLIDQMIPGQGLSVRQAEYMKTDIHDGLVCEEQFEQFDIYSEKRVFKNAVNAQYGIKLNRMIGGLKRLDDDVAPRTKFLFISCASPWHQDIWNILSIETLVGDIYGEFSSQVECWHTRVRSANEAEEIAHFIEMQGIDIVGFSIEIRTLALFDTLFHKICTNKPEMPLLIYGGKVPSYAYAYFEENYLLNDAKSIIIVGDGERSLRDTIRFSWSEINAESINNAIWKDAEGCVRYNQQDERVESLRHPPVLISTKKGQVNILETSRGCYCQCAYCAQGYRLWSPLPIDRVIENLERLFANSSASFEFVDNDFLGGRNAKHIERAQKIANCIERLSLKYRLKATYRVFTNPLVIARYNESHSNESMIELLRYMRKTGLERIYIGIESASVNQRRRYNRKDTLDECIKSLDILRALDITIDAGFIMFDPQMEVEDLRENINFFKKMNLLDINTYPFSDLRLTMNTPLVEAVQKDQLITGVCLEELCYQYKFKNDAVNLIAKTILGFARKTGKLFQIMKYITKEKFDPSKKKEAELFAWEVVQENARIYLDMMEEIVNKYESGVEIYNVEIDKARNRLFGLLDRIETNIVLFRENPDHYAKILCELHNSRLQLVSDMNETS